MLLCEHGEHPSSHLRVVWAMAPFPPWKAGCGVWTLGHCDDEMLNDLLLGRDVEAAVRRTNGSLPNESSILNHLSQSGRSLKPKVEIILVHQSINGQGQSTVCNCVDTQDSSSLSCHSARQLDRDAYSARHRSICPFPMGSYGNHLNILLSVES